MQASNDPTVRDRLRDALSSAIDRYGSALLHEPGRLKILLDQVGAAGAPDVGHLMSGLSEQVPQRLLAAESDTALATLLPRLVDALVTRAKLERSAAIWTLQAWTHALGLSPVGLEAPPTRAPAPSPVRPAGTAIDFAAVVSPSGTRRADPPLRKPAPVANAFEPPVASGRPVDASTPASPTRKDVASTGAVGLRAASAPAAAGPVARDAAREPIADRTTTPDSGRERKAPTGRTIEPAPRVAQPVEPVVSVSVPSGPMPVGGPDARAATGARAVGADEAPATVPGERPAVEAPAVEDPAVEVPAVEVPAVEVPVIEVPAVETQRAGAPVIEALAPMAVDAPVAPVEPFAPAATEPVGATSRDAPAAASTGHAPDPGPEVAAAAAVPVADDTTAASRRRRRAAPDDASGTPPIGIGGAPMMSIPSARGESPTRRRGPRPDAPQAPRRTTAKIAAGTALAVVLVGGWLAYSNRNAQRGIDSAMMEAVSAAPEPAINAPKAVRPGSAPPANTAGEARRGDAAPDAAGAGIDPSPSSSRSTPPAGPDAPTTIASATGQPGPAAPPSTPLPSTPLPSVPLPPAPAPAAPSASAPVPTAPVQSVPSRSTQRAEAVPAPAARMPDPAPDTRTPATAPVRLPASAARTSQSPAAARPAAPPASARAADRTATAATAPPAAARKQAAAQASPAACTRSTCGSVVSVRETGPRSFEVIVRMDDRSIQTTSQEARWRAGARVRMAGRQLVLSKN